jgi:nucleotide-binding universal stress UspA family protein
MSDIDGVLVAFDGTALSKEALDHALTVYTDAPVTALHVIDYVEESYSAEALVGDEKLKERAHERSDELLSKADELAAEHDRAIETVAQVGKAADEILDFADEHSIDVIVIGSHGRSGLSRVLLGSVAETVMRRASIPVTVVR